MRQRVVEEGPSLGVQLSVKLPAASEAKGLGTGQVDAFLAGILSHGPWTAYYQPGLLGEPGGGTEVEHGLALAFGPEVADGWLGVSELAAQLRPESSYESAFVTLGAAHAVDPSLVLDASVVLGLSEDAPDFVFQIGFTQSFGPGSD